MKYLSEFIGNVVAFLLIKISGLDDYDFDPFKSTRMELILANRRRHGVKAEVKHSQRCLT